MRRLGPVAAIYAHDLHEANETIRELRFKLEAYAVLAEFALGELPYPAKGQFGNGIFRLACAHIRGEHPLQWSFGERTVRVE
jgi:hypothetical protein